MPGHVFETFVHYYCKNAVVSENWPACAQKSIHCDPVLLLNRYKKEGKPLGFAVHVTLGVIILLLQCLLLYEAVSSEQ